MTPRDRSAFVLPHEPDLADLSAITKMSVTDFAAYLRCPYRFYLSRVLKLRRLDDAAEELDGLSFGNLAHDVLDTFGHTDAAHRMSEGRIAKLLTEALHERAKQG